MPFNFRKVRVLDGGARAICPVRLSCANRGYRNLGVGRALFAPFVSFQSASIFRNDDFSQKLTLVL